MRHKAWSSIEEVPYCFWRSSIKFQGHTAKKIVDIDLDWAFPDCNSSLNSPMAMKCCTKLETAKERCPIVFQGHPSNFKVTRNKTSPILTQIGHFQPIGRSQLSNSSDLPCFGITWDDLFISDVKWKLCLIVKIFQNGRHFELATNFFTGTYTGSWIYQKDSHEHFGHFELLINALAQILAEWYQFKNLTYFVTWWRYQWRHEYVFT